MMKYMLIMFLLLIACSKTAVEKETLVEVLELQDCVNDADICCEDQCTQFCTDSARTYSKHYLNGNQCGCWCD